MNELNRRNTESVEFKLNEMNTEIYKQKIKIEQLQTTLSSMSERMNALESMVLQQKAKMAGTGASIL
jgi:uncharacterized coiled-coil protein SlyX